MDKSLGVLLISVLYYVLGRAAEVKGDSCQPECTRLRWAYGATCSAVQNWVPPLRNSVGTFRWTCGKSEENVFFV